LENQNSNEHENQLDSPSEPRFVNPSRPIDSSPTLPPPQTGSQLLQQPVQPYQVQQVQNSSSNLRNILLLFFLVLGVALVGVFAVSSIRGSEAEKVSLENQNTEDLNLKNDENKLNSDQEFKPTSEIENAEQIAEVELVSGTIEPYSRVEIDDDPMIGELVVFNGTNFQDETVSVEPDGKYKAIYFLAHWCPHCQTEVPVVQELIDEGMVPENMDIYSVTSLTYNVATEEGNSANYPPQSWLEYEGWTPEVIRDDADNTLFKELGGTGTPYVIYLDGDNKIVKRVSGFTPAAETVNIWNEIISSE